MNRINIGNRQFVICLSAAYLFRIKMKIKPRVKKTVTADLTITDVFDPAKQTVEKSMQKKKKISHA